MKQSLLSKYEKIAKKYQDIALISRGIRCCENAHAGGFLLTGINPNGQEKDITTDSQFALSYKFIGNENPYFAKKLDMLQRIIHRGVNVSYLDLFPLRMTDETNFNTFIREHSKIGSDFLSVTKQEIEEIRPKLIIHANKTSDYYWGTNNKHPWMGYKLEALKWENLPFDDPYTNSILYKIVGVKSDEDVVGNNIVESRLSNNSYLFVCNMMGKTGGGYVPYLEPEFVEILWDWCEKH